MENVQAIRFVGKAKELKEFLAFLLRDRKELEKIIYNNSNKDSKDDDE